MSFDNFLGTWPDFEGHPSSSADKVKEGATFCAPATKEIRQ